MALSLFTITNQAETIADFLPAGLSIRFIKFDREGKEVLKKASAMMLLLDLLDNPSHRDVRKLLKAIPLNTNYYLLVLSNKEDSEANKGMYSADEVIHSYEELGQNAERLTCLYNLLHKNDEQMKQMQSQTNLLLSINHFAQFRTPWEQLLVDFSLSLASFCSATSTLSFDNKKKTLRQLNNESSDEKVKISESAVTQLKKVVAPSAELSQPNVNLLVEDELQQQLNAELGAEIEAILSFPLVVYEQTFQTVICLIDKQQMSNISVQQIDIMKEAAIQLRILIERRVAENKLKSQFQRLRNTLQELQTTKDQLVHSEKMAAVGKLAAGIAHEINNPLSYVLGNLEPLDEYVNTIVKLLSMHDELLGNLDGTIGEQSNHLKLQIVQEQEEEDLEFVLEDIKAIVDNSKEGLLRMKDIINDLSSFSRQQPLELQNFELRGMFEETVRLLKYEISEGIEVQINSQENLEVKAQRGFTQQIVTNLIKNAVHAIQDAGITPGIIKLSFAEVSDGVQISVEDNGPGIPKDIQGSIFTPFFTTKEIGKGTGLGLSVSYNLAKKMEGKLDLTSKEGKTVFLLTLPTAK